MSSHNYLNATVTSRELRIAQPHENAVYLLDGHLPKERQQIDFIAVGAQPSDITEWRLNDQVIDRHVQRVSWPLLQGEYHLRVICHTSEASVKFSVR